MKKKNKGFTLIELLAVIVILGLLMAIAIPSVTKYITQSRKKTLTNTIGNYMGALVNEVNDMVYTFTGTNTIYAVPIECIAVERGGTNPFGKWMQANNSYWAYVLVQYDDQTSSYKYGFTFKDSAGYGLYPTSQAKINEKGSQIVTGLNLSKPTNGLITTITPLVNWTNSGFKVDSSTKLKVLVAGSEDQVGDGVNTCTLVQKGDNYASIEQEENNSSIPDGYRLLNASDIGKVFGVDLEPTIFIDTSVIPNLTYSFDYVSFAINTNDGEIPYYFSSEGSVGITTTDDRNLYNFGQWQDDNGQPFPGFLDLKINYYYIGGKWDINLVNSVINDLKNLPGVYVLSCQKETEWNNWFYVKDK